jgi:predicted murein hydrolase (TIGR00659 family)
MDAVSRLVLCFDITSLAHCDAVGGARHPPHLLWLAATLAAYALGDALFRASGRRPWVNPVLIAVAVLAGLLWLTATPYPAYFEGAQFVHFMLGPATVALAVPLHANLGRVRAAALPMLAGLLAGSLTAIGSALGIAWVAGVRGEALLSLAPKSATAPVALGISEAIGGSPTLTAVLVILTGITGAVIATPLLDALGIRDWRARGFATGVAAHGIGTARAFQVNETAGAFAGVGMGLNAVLTALLAPWLIRAFL